MLHNTSMTKDADINRIYEYMLLSEGEKHKVRMEARRARRIESLRLARARIQHQLKSKETLLYFANEEEKSRAFADDVTKIYHLKNKIGPCCYDADTVWKIITGCTFLMLSVMCVLLGMWSSSLIFAVPLYSLGAIVGVAVTLATVDELCFVLTTPCMPKSAERDALISELKNTRKRVHAMVKETLVRTE